MDGPPAWQDISSRQFRGFAWQDFSHKSFYNLHLYLCLTLSGYGSKGCSEPEPGFSSRLEERNDFFDLFFNPVPILQPYLRWKFFGL